MQPVVTGVISDILKLIFKIIFGVLKLFSLAVVYALVGVVLYLAVGFNPFNGDTYSTLYIIGFVLAVIASLLLAFRKKGGKKEQKEREEEKPVSLFARLNERKRIKAEKEKEEIARLEKDAREEEIRAQERRLEDLRAERLREEIAREERLIEEYRKESAQAAMQRYEEVVSARPVTPEEIYESKRIPTSRFDEVNYYGGDWGAPKVEPKKEETFTEKPKAPDYGFRMESIERPKVAEKNYFSALNDAYVEPKIERFSQPTSAMRCDEPKIYMSAIEPNTLIHEYSDRFEVYLLEGGEKTLKDVLYKE